MRMVLEDGDLRFQDPFQIRNQAQVALAEGRAGKAVSLMMRALAAAPDDPELHQELGLALEEVGDYPAAIDSFRTAIALRPDHAQAYNNLGNSLQGIGKDSEALDAYRRAEAISPDSPAVQANIANMLESLGQYNDAVDRYQRAIRLDPEFTIAYFHYARALLAAGEPGVALAAVEQCLRRDPHVQPGLALKSLLLQELGRPDEARELVDIGRFVKAFRPGPPDGYETVEEFHRDLIAHMENHPTLSYELYASSTHGGRHSLNLLWDEAKPAQALKTLVQGVYEDYLNQLIDDAPNSVLRDPMPQCRASAQAQLLNSGGYLDSHVHPGAWLSAAYYVQIPDEITGSNDQAGWIEFGRPPEYIKITVEPETQWFKPEEGMMVAFPSSYFHGVKPFESPDLRISLGTDLIPVDTVTGKGQSSRI